MVYQTKYWNSNTDLVTWNLIILKPFSLLKEEIRNG